MKCQIRNILMILIQHNNKYKTFNHPTLVIVQRGSTIVDSNGSGRCSGGATWWGILRLFAHAPTTTAYDANYADDKNNHCANSYRNGCSHTQGKEFLQKVGA